MQQPCLSCTPWLWADRLCFAGVEFLVLLGLYFFLTTPSLNDYGLSQHLYVLHLDHLVATALQPLHRQCSARKYIHQPRRGPNLLDGYVCVPFRIRFSQQLHRSLVPGGQLVGQHFLDNALSPTILRRLNP